MGKVCWRERGGQLCKWKTSVFGKFHWTIRHVIKKVGVTSRKCNLAGDGEESPGI